MPGRIEDAGAALKELYARRDGVLALGETVTPIRFIIDGRAGRIITPAARHVLDHAEGTLFVPDEGERSVQLMVEISAADPIADGEACDRWQAYHIRPTGPLWAQMRVSGMRHGATVLDEGDIDLRNPLIGDEPKLCRELNADRPGVVRALARVKVDETEPTAVGVDALGIDVRCRIGIVRLAFNSMVLTAEAARFEIARILRA